ncbi:hypothetical protein CCR75_001204 [Bremia lactucae]|uniref:CCHC-type domain-containing protein n=1 Tax=Bremia lactucae TaxID=4779 RepID=A0A976FQM5_BRELC|nr:hypothetical protein CCR75_001204 [Bremia lactucae]
MIRDETIARGAWDVLEDFFNRRTMHNRVALNQKAAQGIVTTLAAASDPLDEQRQLIILLGSLPREHHVTIKIIEYIEGVTMLQARLIQHNSEIGVLPKPQSDFAPICFKCGKVGHKADCRSSKKKGSSLEYVFAVVQS